MVFNESFQSCLNGGSRVQVQKNGLEMGYLLSN